ncbi:hypothetical protein L596_029928 [Steinernema carpocapsae]|uniref:Uncharacterized protein n=1 Tax=Steinernema carpocapsae TaxID=34508 RepID=A0A4U5LR89_STECR|nr:hypothetical protein L596_029928 [Steinernema carpocapsae]
MQELCKECPENVRFCRIGQRSDRPRLIKVVLPFPELGSVAMTYVRALKTFKFKGVFVRRSLEIPERVAQKTAYKQLLHRRSLGENVVLRNGSIVQLSGNSDNSSQPQANVENAQSRQ